MLQITDIKRSSDMVMLFDGLVYHIETNGNRINARHGQFRQTNLLFFDGQAETMPTEKLPGGMGDPNGAITAAAFTVANLRANYPPPNPLWLLDQ